MVRRYGDDIAEQVLGSYRCSKNAAIDHFVRHNAMNFTKQGLPVTHVVM